jgi:hypothetical protein
LSGGIVLTDLRGAGRHPVQNNPNPNPFLVIAVMLVLGFLVALLLIESGGTAPSYPTPAPNAPAVGRVAA